MTCGLQVFDSAGNALLDTSDGVARLWGEYGVGAISRGSSRFTSVPGMAADGNWIAFQLSSQTGVYGVVQSNGFTVYSEYADVGSTSWIVVRKDGAIISSGFGFSAVNQNDGVQIDQDYVNYVKLASGQNVSSGTAFPSVVGAKIFAARPSIDGNTIWAANYGGSVIGIVTSAGTYDWVAYGPQTEISLPPSGYGLRVYRGDGSVAYDSNSRLMRPINNISVPTDGTSVNRALTAGPSGMRPYLSAYNIPMTQLVDVGGNNGLVLGPKITFNNNTSITANVGAIGSGPPVNAGPWMSDMQIQFFTDY